MNASSIDHTNKFDELDIKIERIMAYCDQKFDDIANTLEELESRINNLR